MCSFINICNEVLLLHDLLLFINNCAHTSDTTFIHYNETSQDFYLYYFFFLGGGGMIHWEMLVKTTGMFYSINFDIWINLVYMYVMLKYCISIYMYNTHEEQLSKTQMVYIVKVWWKHLELLLSFCKLNTGLYNHIVINGQKDGKQKCQTL